MAWACCPESTQLYELCKACSSAQNCAALWKYMYKRYCGLRTIRGQAQVPHWQCTSIKLCQSALACGRLVREESPGLGTSPGLALRNTAPQNRVAAVLPRTVRPAPGASKRGPHPHLLPGLHIIFCLVLRGVVAKRDASLGRLRKTGFPGAGPPLRCAAGHPIAQFRGLTRSLIVFLSTHDRELLAQAAKNRFQPWNRGKKLNCPRRGSRARDRRDTRAGRKLVLKLRGGARARKPR